MWSKECQSGTINDVITTGEDYTGCKHTTNDVPWTSLMAKVAPNAASSWSSASFGNLLHENENGEDTTNNMRRYRLEKKMQLW